MKNFYNTPRNISQYHLLKKTHAGDNRFCYHKDHFLFASFHQKLLQRPEKCMIFEWGGFFITSAGAYVSAWDFLGCLCRYCRRLLSCFSRHSVSREVPNACITGSSITQQWDQSLAIGMNVARFDLMSRQWLPSRWLSCYCRRLSSAVFTRFWKQHRAWSGSR